MAEDKKAVSFERRDFLRMVGVGAGAAGAVAAGIAAPATAEPAAQAGQDAAYSETEHVRRFYETAKF